MADWSVHRVGHRTWGWSARCGHCGVGGSRARTAGIALRHVQECELLQAGVPARR